MHVTPALITTLSFISVFCVQVFMLTAQLVLMILLLTKEEIARLVLLELYP